MNIFEQGTKEDLLFGTEKGVVNIYDLWKLPLTSTKETSLNSIAKNINKILKLEEEEDFVNEISTQNKSYILRLDIIKHIIKVKKEENRLNKLSVENKAKKQQILQLLADKKNTTLANKSEEELETLLANL